MIPFLAGLFPVRTAVIVATVLACLAGSYFLGRAHEAKGWKLREAEHAAATQKAISIEQAKQRQTEARWQVLSDSARKELDDAQKTIAYQAGRLNALRVDTGRLRDQLTAYASGGPGSDTITACQDRGQTLATYAAEVGIAAQEIAGLAIVAAKERDEFAAEVMACVAAWPSR